MPNIAVSGLPEGSGSIDISQEEYNAIMSTANPIHWSEDARFQKRTTSVGITPTEIYRVPLMQLTGYSITVTVIGVDRGNGNIKKVSGDYTIKRLNAAPILVGESIPISHQDTAAATWKIDRSFLAENGTTYGVISVIGAAGRTIDWVVRGMMFRFSPNIPELVAGPVPDPPPPKEPEVNLPPDLSDFPIGEPE